MFNIYFKLINKLSIYTVIILNCAIILKDTTVT